MPSRVAAQDHQLSRRRFLRGATAVALVGVAGPALAACGRSAPDGKRESASTATGARAVTLYRQVGCSCCATYADYLRDNGFSVGVETLDDLEPIRKRHGIPKEGVGCHTSTIDGYVVEGHVPVEAVERLLSERPELDGISVVGMPVNSPGMGEPNGQPLNILSFRNGRVNDYMSVTTF